MIFTAQKTGLCNWRGSVELMTSLEIIDRVTKHLLCQGVPSETAYESCAYRGEEGRKCAVGVLIPDDEYKSYWDIRFGTKIEVVKSKCPSLRGMDLQLLKELQEIHDSRRPETWAWKLAMLRSKYANES